MGHFRTALVHIRRAPYQSLAAILVTSLTFFVASLFIFLAAGSLRVLNFFETRPQVTAFLKDEAKPLEIENLKSNISAMENVREVKFISKEEALRIYREQNKSDPLLLEMVTANILPASLDVSATSLEALGEVAAFFKKQPIVEEVAFQEDVVATLSRWTQAIRTTGIWIISFLFFISLLIILVISGVKIALRQEEIEILRLVGAGTWYISWPFILEGVIYGAIGAMLGWGANFLVFLQLSPFLNSFLAEIPLLPVPPIFLGLTCSERFAVGILIGVLGSLTAVRRYLR